MPAANPFTPNSTLSLSMVNSLPLTVPFTLMVTLPPTFTLTIMSSIL